MPQTKKSAESALFTRLASNKILQILLLVLAISSVVMFYTFATSGEDFFSKSHELYEADRKSTHQKPSQNQLKKEAESNKNKMTESQAKLAEREALKHAQEFANDYHILFLFTKVKTNQKLKNKFNIAFESLFENAAFKEEETLHLHFVCDDDGRNFAVDYLEKHVAHPKFAFKVHFHNASSIARQDLTETRKLQKIFGQKHAYYEDTIFFLSLSLHKILPDYVHRIVQLDLDLKFMTNIRDLWDEFSYFSRDNLIGLAYENQPVYRHTLWKYRQEHPDTSVGNPPPKGQPGFNSGVMLLHLDHIRSSYLYKSYLDPNRAKQLVEKYSFEGHLGDQDFFSLLSFEHPELFFVLDCTWNRQLCQWWKNKGYQNVFHKYFDCVGDVKIWHGNCDTPIPT